MARSSFIDPTSDFGRQLTADVAVLALTLPAAARDMFYQIILPFIFSASLLLVILFFIPFRDVPFVAQHATRGLNALRTILIVLAAVNFLLDGYTRIDPLTIRWFLSAFVAVTGLAVLTIDLRRTFSS